MKKIIADLHLHSKYSRAVSQEMVLENMTDWAKIKGLNLLAAPDFTHPLWFKELKNKLKLKSRGVYCLKNAPEIGFIVSGEISSIYSQNGKTRRIHNLVFAPDLDSAFKINKALLRAGANLSSDGRPIIGLSSIQLADLVLSANPECLIIPAHIWTPWFSLYGSRSGFDSLQECFGQYANNIFAIETGISSDPKMNWPIKDLENLSILSFSDAHSLPKIGREATIFKTKNKKGLDFTYSDLALAVKRDKAARWHISSTIEFYPEEGRYHYDGHRKCKIRRSPEETRKKGNICPVCAKSLTLGVAYQVAKIANLGGSASFQKRPPFITVIPLLEIIAEVEQVGANSKRVKEKYSRMVKSLGSEIDVLLNVSLEKIKNLFGLRMSEAIERNRLGKISIDPGFDGQFGKVNIWPKKGESLAEKQIALF
ncbi:MAG: endonuclease Q family protein [Candidatus Shapirobacteria bacterium]